MKLTLTSLNPSINSWFVLQVEAQGYWDRPQAYHFENADPDLWQISLIGGENATLMIEGDGEQIQCAPWEKDYSELDAARDQPLPYAPICGGRFYLRNQVSGSRTNREAMADFLRNNVVFGDSIVNLIKGSFYEDAFMQSSETVEDVDDGATVAALGQANLSRFPSMYTSPGFDLVGTEDGRMQAGNWYAVKNAPGIFASVMQPGMIHTDILNRSGETNWLDGIEGRADVHLVAFDMETFEIGYQPGTSHPGFGWSSRPHGAGRDWRIPGPDGIDSPAPLVMTGMLSPALTDRVAATFTGGYKRDHGAFRYGPKATFNHGHHYGFLTNGTTLSRLWPGLSTLFLKTDGTLEMRMWTEEDNAMLPDLLFARQNGVPLIEQDPETGEGVPGSLVRQWGAGNWSGSADANLRTVRGGMCMRTVEGRQFLIYAYFSTATPSAMARTFQAYSCDNAMLLDMNSQEHTYMALYPQNEDGDWIEAQHLVRGMRAIDQRRRDGSYIPRFVGYADNRDFFYLLRKDE
ncbi:MAG: hypothetical protein GY945_16465 [Rhodobacteraceae bacterium]|nr:hypothetical protein [Paracoccaceae bacterium]